MIEKVIMKVTLKAGENVWEKGAVLTAPLPPDILNEMYSNTGTVEVVSGDHRTSTKLVSVPQFKEEQASSMTTMEMPKPEDSEPKPKLLRRR